MVGVIPSTPDILINGARISPEHNFAILDLRIEQSLGVPAKLTLTFTDAHYELIDSNKYKIGTAIQVKFPTNHGEIKTVFDGEVTSVGLDQMVGSLPELIVEAHDKTHRLGNKTSIKTFANQSYHDIVGTIAGELGLGTNLEADLGSVKHLYTVITGSYADFLNRVAAATGTEWTVEDGALTVRKRGGDSTVAVLDPTENLRRFKVRYSSSGIGQSIQVRAWDPQRKEAIVATDAGVSRRIDGASAPGGEPNFWNAALAYGGPYVNGTTGAQTMDEAAQIAKSIAARQSTNQLIARGEAMGAPEIRAGSTVKIENVGNTMSGAYFVTEVEHIFGVGGDLRTRFTAGGTQASTIVDLVGAPAAPTADWGTIGLVIGLVTNNKDPDHLGRVKVKFPTLTDADESAWARIASVSAGNGRGFQFTPAINDEVVIGFEHGDLRRPLVLGSLWNARDKPPQGEDGKLFAGNQVKEWVIKSRLGHMLLFHDGDSPDQKRIALMLAGEKTLLNLGDDKVELWAKDNTSVEVKCGAASLVLKNNDVTIKGNNITIDAAQKLVIKGTAGVEQTSSTTMKIEAKATLDIKASAAATVDGGGMLTLKGGIAKIN